MWQSVLRTIYLVESASLATAKGFHHEVMHVARA